MAWSQETQRAFIDGDRDWVRSVGVAMRVNALGFAIVEVDYVRPLGPSGARLAVAVQSDARVLTFWYRRIARAGGRPD